MTTLKDRYNLPTPIRLPRAEQIGIGVDHTEPTDWFRKVIPSAGSIPESAWRDAYLKTARGFLGRRREMIWVANWEMTRAQSLACMVAGFEALGYRRCE